MPIEMVIVGAGGFGRETLDVIEAVNRAAAEPAFEVLGIVDSDPSDKNLERLAERGVAWLGTEATWLASGAGAAVLVGVGDPATRSAIRSRLGASPLPPALVHPRSTVGSVVRLGAGVVICAGVHLSTNIALGDDVHLNPGVVVGHDTTIGECVSIFPGAVIAGDVTIERGVTVGTGAVILPGLHIGAGAIVGASACVVGNVPPGATVKGVPAR